jgi:nucleotide-binding universal stress UspA family protein
VLYAAHEKGDSEAILQHTVRHLEHIHAIATELQIPVTQVNEIGDISKLLPEQVTKEQVDLVFYPQNPDKQYRAGQQQTVRTLLQNVSSDLAVIRAVSMAKPHPGRILVPLGKVISNSDRRLVFITALAKSFHAQVTLFHLFAARTVSVLPETIIRFREQLQEQQVQTLERSGVGEIGKAISVEAITRHNDLIVIGASDRGALRRLFQGNPAHDIMQQPPCNTILFRGAGL